jgi:hypothetical protein
MTLTPRIKHQGGTSVPLLVIPSPRDHWIICKLCGERVPRFGERRDDGTRVSGMGLLVNHQIECRKRGGAA